MEDVKLIQKELPGYESTFLENLGKADTLTMHQLIQAIFRERVVPNEWRNDGSVLVLFVSSGELHVPVSHLYIFQHIDIDGDIFYIDRDKSRTLVDQTETCLKLLFPGNNPSDFHEEVMNSVRNLALALTVAEYRRRQMENSPAENTLTYAALQKSPLTFLEQWVIQGHTIHPCSRTRIGLTPEDIARYAPEWEGTPAVIPLLVHKDRCHMTSRNGETTKSILFGEYSQLEKEFERVCITQGVAAEEYEIIPVHPWQWERTIKKYYKDALNQKWLLPMSETISTAALISLRTLAPLSDRCRHHIKTAVNVQMTSAVRTVSAASTKNGPTLSRLFQTILSHDERLSRSLSVMGEEVGIHYVPAQKENVRFLKKNVAAILRDNPECNLKGDEIAVPAASMLAPSPLSGKLIVEEMAEVYPSAQAFIYDYAKTVLPGMLTLITKYGISMEAHLQNCVVLFEKGKPKKAVLRDYGGIRIMNERLEQFFDQQPIDPSTNLLTKDRSELLDVFSHALFHNHLGEIIVALARKTDASEKEMWSTVEKVILETYDELKKDKQIPASSLLDQEEILTKPTKMKALVHMRLSDQYTENLYVEIPHPFAKKSEVNQDDPALS